VILPALPPLFADFVAKKVHFLYQGTRDGFTAKAFHDHCDGKADTFTIIQDTNGSVLGGFTPVPGIKQGANGAALID
jgi:hypothetical protein